MNPFRNKASFCGEEWLATRPTPQAGGPPLFCFPRLIIQYIRSYTAGRSSIRNLWMRHAVVTATHLMVIPTSYN